MAEQTPATKGESRNVNDKIPVPELIERLRFLSNGFQEGSETEHVMWQAALALESLPSENKDSARLDYLAKTLHIDATGAEPIYAMFVPGTENMSAMEAWDIRKLIDYSMKLTEEK